MVWERHSVKCLSDLQMGNSHPVPGGVGAVHHPEHHPLRGDKGDAECLQILHLPHQQWKVWLFYKSVFIRTFSRFVACAAAALEATLVTIRWKNEKSGNNGQFINDIYLLIILL